MKREQPHPDAYYARKILREIEHAVADPAPIPWRLQRKLRRLPRLVILTTGPHGIDIKLALQLLDATAAARDKIRAREKAKARHK